MVQEEGRGGAGGVLVQLIGLYIPVTTHRQVPAVPLRGRAPDQFIDRVVDFPVVLQRRVPTVQTVQLAAETLQVPFLDRV